MSRKISDVSCSDYVFYSEKKDKRTYTVDRRDSSISHESTNVEDGNCYALFLCIVKWITAIILSTLVLFCIVGSKICLLALGQHFKSIKRSGNDTISLEDHNVPIETQKQALFLMLLLALMIPQAMSLLYASWTSLTRKSRPWPKKQGFIAVRIIAFLNKSGTGTLDNSLKRCLKKCIYGTMAIQTQGDASTLRFPLTFLNLPSLFFIILECDLLITQRNVNCNYCFTNFTMPENSYLISV